jgi:hypothetical protein
MVMPRVPWPNHNSPTGLTLPFEQVYGNWEEWFAWRPVTTISNERVWLRKIYRRRWYLFMLPRNGGTQYGNLLDLLR